MSKPTILHIGEPIKYNHEFYESEFVKRFTVVRNEDLDRNSFIKALKTKKYVGTDAITIPTSSPSSRYGDFVAIFRLHF